MLEGQKTKKQLTSSQKQTKQQLGSWAVIVSRKDGQYLIFLTTKGYKRQCK